MKKHIITATADDKGLRIDQFLSQKVEDLSRNQARKALQRGGVYLGRRRIKICSYRIRGHEQLTIYVAPPGSSPVKTAPDSQAQTKKEVIPENKSEPSVKEVIPKKKSGPGFEEKDIVFLDMHIVAINKPVGVPAQETRSSSEGTAKDLLAQYLQDRGEKNLNVSLIHRLDQNASGLMMFSRTKQANISLTNQFKNHTIIKSYLAIVCGELAEETGEVRTPLPEPANDKKKRGHEKPDKTAQSSFEVLERFPDYLWLKIEPRTGKTHQIRIQYSQKGLPLLGDTKYGGEELPSFFENHPYNQVEINKNRFLLHSYSLTFQHPKSDMTMELAAPIPNDMKEILNLLRQS
ncbi:RluA family pseudouridine synthase [candidate division CSSED10-310 bacterium]|uniref:Pseudouridine synthase n=1 Tax=candidate division CSSED10-310 bacterium TaxID=2855610 RepID=A0ABV6YZ67_UNCC1